MARKLGTWIGWSGLERVIWPLPQGPGCFATGLSCQKGAKARSHGLASLATWQELAIFGDLCWARAPDGFASAGCGLASDSFAESFHHILVGLSPRLPPQVLYLELHVKSGAPSLHLYHQLQ